MDGSDHVRRRPDLWSYISFSRPQSRNGFSNNTRLDEDPYEKAARRTSGRAHSTSISLTESQTSRIHQPQRGRLWKIMGVVAAFVLVVLLLGRTSSGGKLSQKFGASYKGLNPATGKCTESYTKDKPLMQYALMIDAGSTGSRIHVYRFNNCGSTPELEDEIFEQTAKKEGGSGLSSYDADAEGAARSLDVLMKVAVENVPKSHQSCTPIAVKATAGLRKLGEEKSKKTLAAVRARLETQYPFPVIADSQGGVEVMEGTDEGVYAWITANYLLDKIGGPEQNPTAAVFDLGGGSTQIVFEPSFPLDPKGGMPEEMAEGDHKYALNFGGRKFNLYQHSYLGYGLMAARESLHKLVFDTAYENSGAGDPSFLSQPLINPCINVGTTQEVPIELDAGHALGRSVTVTMVGPRTNSATQCRALAEKTLHKEADCKLTPCAFNGVYQPSFTQTFARQDVYLFSYFYDRTKPLGMPDTFTLTELRDLAGKACGGESEWGVFSGVDGALEELRSRPQTCLDLNFMVALLNTGYEMPMEREVKIAKKIKSRELGWCLGASLPLLSKESGWQCKLSEIH